MKKYKILDSVENPSDIKQLSFENLNELCRNLREFIVDNVSKTGGHLASNLGIVELSVAIEKVFDSNTDRVVFDVGHQSYVHKILTGRKNKFNMLRKFGGISGFTNPVESDADASISGHASASVSTAVGMCRARTILGKNYNVLAVIGDGALTGGMAYEALNNAGASGEPMIVVLNDNNMSITKNVGAMSKHLAKLRINPGYLRVKTKIYGTLENIPGGKSFSNFITGVKSGIKTVLLPSSMFEQMGFAYLGPVDGHDLKQICEALEMAKSFKKPVLIHVITQKGKGYRYSEDSPDKYHGVSKFNIVTGKPLKASNKSFSNAFGEKITTLALTDKRICAITAAMQSGTGLNTFAKTFPERFFDVGIAEEHAVTMSAGMAKQGLKPICTIYSTFMQRGFDQLIHDVAIDNIDVVFAIDRAGIVGEDGATHNGVFDVGFLRQIPNFTLFAPSNFAELSSMIDKCVYKINGPSAIRFSRGGEGNFTEDTSMHNSKIIKTGQTVTLISYGIMINEVLSASKMLEDSGISCEVIKLNNLSDYYCDQIKNSILKTKTLIVVEDVVHMGCIGQEISEKIALNGITIKSIKLLNTGNRFLPPGNIQQIYKYCSIDAESIKKSVMEAIEIE